MEQLAMPAPVAGPLWLPRYFHREWDTAVRRLPVTWTKLGSRHVRCEDCQACQAEWHLGTCPADATPPGAALPATRIRTTLSDATTTLHCEGHFNMRQAELQKARHVQPNVMGLDENITGSEPGWQAVCWAKDCSWCSPWQYDDRWPDSNDPHGEAREEAAHLANEHLHDMTGETERVAVAPDPGADRGTPNDPEAPRGAGGDV